MHEPGSLCLTSEPQLCRCGLVVEGDEVLRVGGKRVKSLSVREVMELMRAGDVGSKVLRPFSPPVPRRFSFFLCIERFPLH